jgi:hypothetical protein
MAVNGGGRVGGAIAGVAIVNCLRGAGGAAFIDVNGGGRVGGAIAGVAIVKCLLYAVPEE